MRSIVLSISIGVCLAATTLPAPAGEPSAPPADAALERVIDDFVAARLESEKIMPAPQADEWNLLRRLTLDLGGRIPTRAEAQAYAADTSAKKRIELVDRLLASPDFAYHQRNELDRLLLANKPNDNEFRKYLLWAARENRAWDAMFRDMLLGDDGDEHRQAATTFLKSRARDLDDITNDTASVFLGVNVTCAKCHDHPLAPDWKQHHYFGMVSFFSRTYVTKKNILAEKPFGEVKFSSKKAADTLGEQTAKFQFLTGSVVEEPVVERSKDEIKKVEEAVKAAMQKDDAPPPAKPEFSPRAKLVEVALRAEDNRFFARNIVNRIWARLMGRGLVDPPDQMHSANPPSHPELLDWLARDTVAHGYDLKRLIRGIVLSQAYSRSSEWTHAGDLPAPALIAVAKVKTLTPRQYGASLVVASANPTQWPTSDRSEQWATRREQLETAGNGWAAPFEMPNDNFQIAVDEALLFSNNKRIEDDLLRDGSDRLVGYLKSLSDNDAAIDAACWAINTRPPRDDERAAIGNYLDKHSSDRLAAIRQVVWAMLTSPELRFCF